MKQILGILMCLLYLICMPVGYMLGVVLSPLINGVHLGYKQVSNWMDSL